MIHLRCPFIGLDSDRLPSQQATRPSRRFPYLAKAIAALLAFATPALAQTTQPATPPIDLPRAIQGKPVGTQLEPPTTWQPADIVPAKGIAACQTKVEQVSDSIVSDFAAPLSALLQGDGSAEIVAAIENLVTQSRAQLDEAAKCLAADEVEGDDDAIWELTDRVAMLRAFVDLFAAMAAPAADQASRDPSRTHAPDASACADVTKGRADRPSLADRTMPCAGRPEPARGGAGVGDETRCATGCVVHARGRRDPRPRGPITPRTQD